MTQEYPDRVWLYPPKFWAATQSMSKEEVDVLMDRLWTMAEQCDTAGLSQFDFIQVGNPYKKSAA